MNRKKVAKWLFVTGSFVVLANNQGRKLSYAAENTQKNSQESQVILHDRIAGRRFLMETVSAAAGSGERQEFMVTGKEGSINTLAIAQMFPDVINISKTEIGKRMVDGESFTDCRIGFEWRKRAPDGGGETVPGSGDSFGEEEDRQAWRTGDVIARKIAGKYYRFRCIDDDYRDGSGSYGKHALFLAQQVIRSDVDSTYEERIQLPFGENNNYKKSQVREWLRRWTEEENQDLSIVYTGTVTAFSGKSGDGAFEETRMDGLRSFPLAYQECRDRLFLLSLEEAYQYREELWNLDGAKSPYSRGFWLRTPAYREDGNGKFIYGNMEYAVDLENGCFRQADVSDTGFGICPAFCLPQA